MHFLDITSLNALGFPYANIIILCVLCNVALPFMIMHINAGAKLPRGNNACRRGATGGNCPSFPQKTSRFFYFTIIPYFSLSCPFALEYTSVHV